MARSSEFDPTDIRVTRDVDATWEPSAAVSDVIAEIAAERGLEVDWINPAAASWLRTDAPSQSGGFEVVIATPEQLVAMKLAAGREQDLADLRILAKHLGIASAQALVDIAYGIYGEDSVELPDGRESYLRLAQAVVDSLAG